MNAARDGGGDPPADAPPPPAEQRPKPRQRVLLGGVIVYGGGLQTVNCMIRDLSESGARIAIPKGTTVPINFYLINVRDGIGYEVRMIWSRGSDAGVAFDKTFSLRDGLDPALGFLKRAWLARATR